MKAAVNSWMMYGTKQRVFRVLIPRSLQEILLQPVAKKTSNKELPSA